MARTAVGIGRCDGCGQTAIISDREPGLFLCRACQGEHYGASGRHEAQRLFEPAPAPMPGQLGLGDG